MSAYIVVEIEVQEPIQYERYKQLADQTIREYGGHYLVRGGKAETLEGNRWPKRLVVVEFRRTTKQRRGGIRRSTRRQKRSDKRRQRQK